MEAISENWQCGLDLKYTAVTAATSFDDDIFSPPTDTILYFNSGGTSEIVVGHKITGATSSATAVVKGLIVMAGTWAAGTAEGYLFLSQKTGTFQAENITIPGGSDDATIIGDTRRFPFVRQQAKGALITAESATMTFTQSGETPTVASGTNIGIQLPASESFVIKGINSMKNFKFINTVASNNAILKVQVYY